MKRIPSCRKAAAKADRLLAGCASAAALADALHAIAVLDAVPGAATLTELAARHLRGAGKAARTRPPLTLRAMFELRRERYAPAQRRSIGALECAERFFCRKLGPETEVAGLTDAQVEKALAEFGSADSWNSLFRRLRLCLNWAAREKLVERSPLRTLGPRRVDWREPAHFLPDRVERIMRTAEAHPGPLEGAVGASLALGFFAGVRTVEILRARWEDLDLEAGTLRIPRPKGYTNGRRPRLVELEANAVAWLRLWRGWTAAATAARPAGRIVAQPFRLLEWKKKWLEPAGLSWGNDAAHNVMRHTYATMHVGAFRNAAATALNLGHGRGTDLLERHYRGLVPRAVAQAHWRILPSASPPPPPEPLPGRGRRTDIGR
ncbi:MAG: tyrosine-type recombinase/integrase [Kiritimatiellae bacterium]|nr:tyrosine-type recombinase/integrase [Kiritimatiellia bacterium]